eukprot:CAMPEP_0116059224 /NCGR_PEP_ID=MMETSP0322-20121206/5666_1 /TAXON_ID=163516 /ORGANISM="Leptocylindrus danicus var. apora, Strain B651" /LENGTH=953 /DNA_ID=CAMNT_0003543559 /DNA_START=437 /DNA_END=3298 /DNA_ORIENTATION=+
MADEDDGASMLPNDFWLDMCSHIKEGEGAKAVNLALNPERNTYYNGTHIWNAIYEENCLEIDNNDDNSEMCFEEKVLYRLLSGLHTSTTVSIAKNYFPPSKKKGRVDWQPNPQYFMERFSGHPEYISNLHFSYVVLLRALRRASSYLDSYDIRTGSADEDKDTQILFRRLLDSHVLSSCSSVFSAFDETLMFENAVEGSYSLQENFKGVFHNVSSILDCVQCQQCKLHGKMAMLGYGTALKILFMAQDDLILSRNEVVAFINTLAKMSESMREVRELSHLYFEQSDKFARELPLVDPRKEHNWKISDEIDQYEMMDAAIESISAMARMDMISERREVELVASALKKDTSLLILAKHYASDLDKFYLHTQHIKGEPMIEKDDKKERPDAVVVGSGLAGLTTTLKILDRGGKVVLLEKEHRIGGNSAKASSGINACCPLNATYGDSLDSFQKDTIKSAGDAANLPLIQTLVGNSAKAVSFLKERAGVDLSLLAQLGGHSYKRTHRPNNGMAGAEIIYAMQKAVKSYEKSGQIEILLDTQATKLIQENGTVVGIEYKSNLDGDVGGSLYTPRVILATGGFASDRSVGSYLSKHRPELTQFPATAGDFSTGDGITMATELGAGTTDLEKIQIHPTGWVDPTNPNNPSKVLAAELMRGVGGLLINSKGSRFCNELGTRAYVTDMMLRHDDAYRITGQWSTNSSVPTFSLILASSAADDGRKHVDLYSHKKLLTRLNGVDELANWMKIDVETVKATIFDYIKDAERGNDQWGKTSFRGVPSSDLENEFFYAGIVTPVLHYCMGGVTIDTEGHVLNENLEIIPGLLAAGEVTGGVHGANRLGGNSLLECTVFGSLVGENVPIVPREPQVNRLTGSKEAPTQKKDRLISSLELSKHNNSDDCWVAIHGTVYDLTSFAEEHPPGAESIFELAGRDGTEAFQAVHNQAMMKDFQDEIIGVYEK